MLATTFSSLVFACFVKNLMSQKSQFFPNRLFIKIKPANISGFTVLNLLFYSQWHPERRDFLLLQEGEERNIKRLREKGKERL